MSNDDNIERRTFLKTSLAAVAGTATLGSSGLASAVAGDSADSATLERSSSGIPMKSFGNTGVKLPILGMGGSAMVEAWAPGGYGVKLDSEEKRAEMVRYAFDEGIRYFDNARVYMESESVMGKGLKGVREQAFLASKVADSRPERVRVSVERSLRELDTDYIDLMQIHSPVIEAVGVRGAMKVHRELLKLRDEKMIRFIGMSTHVAFKDVLRLIKTGGFEQVLLAYGYFNKGMDTLLSSRNVEFRGQCLAEAHKRGMAITAMKVMGAFIMGHNAKNLVAGYDSARLSKLPGAAIRWVLQDERVSMLNIGVSLPGDIAANKAILAANSRFTDQDRALLADYAGRAYESPAVRQMRTV